MSGAELQARALARAHDERVHIFKVPGRPGVYFTRSKSEPCRRHSLVVKGDEVACSCRGYQYRQSCKHAEALRNRLAREAVDARRQAATATGQETLRLLTA